MDKEEIIAELRRVAEKLQTPHLSHTEFGRNSRISVTTIKNRFGTWNKAVEAAGLSPIPRGGFPGQHSPRRPDDEYLEEVIRLTRELGKRPTIAEMNANGRFSQPPYLLRWGSFEKACQVAYAKYGFPQATTVTDSEERTQVELALIPTQVIIPQTYRPTAPQRRKKVQFGEPIDFRGLRFAPINEQGVVYLFGMISRELGFLIESIRTDYPDCEGKRCVDQNKQRWEQVLIEFEYQSSNFREHGHHSEGCDLIVCWIHDWENCPIEVLELSSQIKYLPNK